LNKPTLLAIFAGAGCLFVAVSLCYLLVYYRAPQDPQNLIYAQTVAFSAWILTHIFLAFNTRSETQSLIKLGILSNKVMVAWGLVAIAMLIVVTTVPFLQPLIKTTSLSLIDWLLIIIASFAATYWIEIGKLIRKHP
jgi:Ca2+-transporting ATPase